MLREYMLKHSIDINVGEFTELSTKKFEAFIWKNTEETDIERAKKHLQEQLTKFGVEFGKDKYNLYDVHTLKDLLSVKDEKCGCLKGGTDLILGPHGKYMTSIIQQSCVAIELKTKKSVEEKGGLQSFTSQVLLELITSNYHSNQLTIVLLTDLCTGATIFSLDKGQDEGITVTIYKELTLADAANYVVKHLAENCQPNKSYRLKNDKRASMSNEILRDFKKKKVTPIENSVMFEQFHEMLEDTSPFSKERAEVIRNLCRSCELPQSPFLDFYV